MEIKLSDTRRHLDTISTQCVVCSIAKVHAFLVSVLYIRRESDTPLCKIRCLSTFSKFIRQFIDNFTNVFQQNILENVCSRVCSSSRNNNWVSLREYMVPNNSVNTYRGAGSPSLERVVFAWTIFGSCK